MCHLGHFGDEKGSYPQVSRSLFLAKSDIAFCIIILEYMGKHTGLSVMLVFATKFFGVSENLSRRL
jgi:hypothetical protein